MSESQTAQPAPPPLVVNAQYVKDLSFEVPNAPEVFSTLKAQPNVNINLDVQARRLNEGQDVFEVTLQIKAEAVEAIPQGQTNGQAAAGEPKAVFIAELAFCGVFTLNGVPENTIEPVLLVECPRLLFPYARNILADVTRDGGFPPVLLQPIDFVALWQSRREAQGQTAIA
ncbi:MAG: protein-export chaperone SecB [Acetobacteraceae bacterium]